jgi:DNA-binding transcriptional regulator YdaS (Cro superfamily)
MTAIERAIKKAGGQQVLADACGVKYQAVQKWLKRVPAERVLAIESATGISRHELRPDIYPVDGKLRQSAVRATG